MSVPVSFGAFDVPATVERNQATGSGPDGTPLVDWQPIGTVWVRVKQLSGSRRIQADQIHHSATHEVELRTTPTLALGDRLVIHDEAGDVVHTVLDLNPNGARSGVLRLTTGARVG